ncbi:hypothetical protein [Alkalinema sp. FACHB-956]|uniref:hypothetical protein n=1 Tax=Alkalinema sp. FACHB-956 TaxID=2692768 RepID=UPI001688C5E7|nr:hypothetical protein [Alkalinema sp. FACHB-956]MBD2326036.1 hypothetical protein [Alkalinema sp. FACHB-956]
MGEEHRGEDRRGQDRQGEDRQGENRRGSHHELNLEQAIAIANTALQKGLGRSLKDLEEAILRGSYHGLTYQQISEQQGYSEKYLRQDIGNLFWQDLTYVVEERVSKTNFRGPLQRWSQRQQPSIEPASPPPVLPNSDPPIDDRVNDPPRSDSIMAPLVTATQELRLEEDGTIPDISRFYGRRPELDQLVQKLLAPCCLMTIYGLQGIGKTFLAAKLALDDIGASFQVVIWRSLSSDLSGHHPPRLPELLRDLVQVFDPSASKWEIADLLKHFQRSPCFLVLDGWEAVLEPGTCHGSYRPGYEDYGHFLQKLTTTAHQSRIVITSCEKPREVELKEAEQGKVHALALSGWREKAIAQFFADKGVTCLSEMQVRSLLRDSGGHPVVLERVAACIRGPFGGSVERFLDYDSPLFGDIPLLIERQLQRLSAPERLFLNTLSDRTLPFGLQDLQEALASTLLSMPLHELLPSLQRKSILTVNQRDACDPAYYTIVGYIMQYLQTVLKSDNH